MTDLLDAMSAAHARWISPRLADWYPGSARLARSREAMRTPAAWVGDAEFGGTFRDTVAVVDVADPLAWANRRLDLPGGQWCVTGIRFRGLDVTRPFVDVVATSLPPEAAALAHLCRDVAGAYAEFAPLAFRVDAPDPDALVAQAGAHGLGAQVDQYVVAGLVADVRASTAAALAGADGARVTLHAAAPEEMCPEVVRHYAEVGELREGLPAWAVPSTLEELEDCAEEGLLFEVRVDGAPAGVVAARRDDDHGMTGFVVQELVLAPAFLGQGWGRHVLARLAETLPAREDDTLWGTIHADNIPSLRNARSVGREVVGGYVWLALPGMPGMSGTS